MGRAVATSKSKKNAEEDRRKRKNTKSRKRRRVSLSSSSSSSDTDDVSLRRRSSRRKPDKRRGRDPKRSKKRKSRKARRRSVSSASSSTCHSRSSDSLSRSRSPVRGRDGRKGKLKKKVKRGRKLDTGVRSLRSRNRSFSCSTCSGGSGHSQTHSYREAKNKERDDSRQIGSSSIVESRGEVEERHGSKGREVDNEMIMPIYDDSQLSQANVGRDVDIVMDEGSYEQGTEIDRWMSEGNVENDSYFDQFEDSGAQTFEPYKELELHTKLSSRIKSEIVAAEKHDSESDDLELKLRQKALENLKKLRGALSSDNIAIDDRKNVLAGGEFSEKQCETAKQFISSPNSKMNPAMQLPSLEANFSTSDKKTLFSHLNQNRNSKHMESKVSGQSNSNPPNDMEDSPEKIKKSPCGGSQEKNATEGGGSGSSLRPEVNLGDALASGNTFTNEEEKIRENNETLEACQSGSQFEQKTFSRMHDGEMVQVSYKVYIPKKAPALARRKLQR